MKNALPTPHEMIGALVGTPSISSVDPTDDMGNRAVVELLAGWAEGLGFTIERLPIPDEPDKVNLLATLGEGPGGLVLSGHTDTVPCDPELWHDDPFRLVRRDGRLYGLGSTDMKGFFAVALAAASRFRAGDLREPVMLLATADEESGMSGARALLECGRPQGTRAVIGEPTGLAPVKMHKGMLMEGIRVIGHAGHSSDPSLGRNAIEGMRLVIDELLGWRDLLQAEWQDPRFAVPGPTLNLGHVHGGDNPNRICGDCELLIDLRPLPGMDLQGLRTELEARLRRRLDGSGFGLEVRALFPGLPGMVARDDSPLTRLAEELTGKPASAVAFGTEGPFLQELGLDTLIMGPGGIAQAHQPDEYIEETQVDAGIELITRLITASCLRV